MRSVINVLTFSLSCKPKSIKENCSVRNRFFIFRSINAGTCTGILFGTIFNDKSAPGVCSVFISLAGILGGCWMPLETMGGFETFCRFLPFYPSVYIGRIITNSKNALGITYSFNNVAGLGLIPIILFLISSIILTIIAFKKNMVSDK